MTTSFTRAVEVIAAARKSAPAVRDTKDHVSPHIANALAAAGLLAPDLPEPSIWEQGKPPVWKSHGVRMQLTRGKYADGALSTWSGSPEAFRDIAHAMLAAADYAEEHTDAQ